MSFFMSFDTSILGFFFFILLPYSSFLICRSVVRFPVLFIFSFFSYLHSCVFFSYCYFLVLLCLVRVFVFPFSFLFFLLFIPSVMFFSFFFYTFIHVFFLCCHIPLLLCLAVCFVFPFSSIFFPLLFTPSVMFAFSRFIFLFSHLQFEFLVSLIHSFFTCVCFFLYFLIFLVFHLYTCIARFPVHLSCSREGDMVLTPNIKVVFHNHDPEENHF